MTDEHTLNSSVWKFASLLRPLNYHVAYYAHAFVTAFIICQDKVLVNNVIPLARRVHARLAAAAAATAVSDNSASRSSLLQMDREAESQVSRSLQILRRVRMLSDGILPRRGILV